MRRLEEERVGVKETARRASAKASTPLIRPWRLQWNMPFECYISILCCDNILSSESCASIVLAESCDPVLRSYFALGIARSRSL